MAAAGIKCNTSNLSIKMATFYTRQSDPLCIFTYMWMYIELKNIVYSSTSKIMLSFKKKRQNTTHAQWAFKLMQIDFLNSFQISASVRSCWSYQPTHISKAFDSSNSFFSPEWHGGEWKDYRYVDEELRINSSAYWEIVFLSNYDN